MHPRKERLIALFAEIEKEFDALIDENIELRGRLGLPAPEKHQMTRDRLLDGEVRAASPQTQRPSQAQSAVTAKLKSALKKGPQRKPTQVPVEHEQGVVAEKKMKKSNWQVLKDFKGHRDVTWEVSTSPVYSNFLGSASADRTARIWLVDGSSPASWVYTGHKGSVNSIRFHPSEPITCTASGDKSVHLWRVPLRKSPSGVVVSSHKGSKRGNKREEAREFDEKEDGNESGYSTDEEEEENRFRPKKRHEEEEDVIKTTLTPQDSYALEDEQDRHIKHNLLEMKGHSKVVVAADWLNSDSIVSCSWDRNMIVWNLESGTEILRIPDLSENFHTPTNLHPSPSKRSIFAASYSHGVINVYDVRNPAGATEYVTHSIPAHDDISTTVKFSSNEEHILLSGGDDKTVKVWDLRNTRQPTQTIRCSAAVGRFSLSPKTSTLAIPLHDRNIRICDTKGVRVGNLRSSKLGHKGMVTATAWAMDESVLFSCGVSPIYQTRILAWSQQKKVK